MIFKESRKFLGKTIDDVLKYMSIDFNNFIKDLFVGITKLDFASNFDQFTVNITVATGAEAKIINRLSRIPSGYIVLKNSTGMAIADGTTAWSKDFVYVRNIGGVDTNLTIMFVR
jgi:hypothetical protein